MRKIKAREARSKAGKSKMNTPTCIYSEGLDDINRGRSVSNHFVPCIALEHGPDLAFGHV